MIHLHLFSLSGEQDIRSIVEVCRTYLEDQPEARVAYLPMASLSHLGEEYTGKAFHGLARIETIDTERMELPQIESILRRAHLLYIPGGNAFLLNHRLHISHLMPYLSKKVQTGLPLVASGAGVEICGPNILTSNDLNMVGTSYFKGMDVTPFNFNVHYDDSPERDNRLADYHVFHDNPILLLGEAAHLTVEGKTASLASGRAWAWHKGQEKERLEIGRKISP